MKENSRNREEFGGENSEKLALYRDPQHWVSLTSAERERLALLFVAQGEAQCQRRLPESQDSFETAIRIAPGSYEVMLRIGQAYLLYAADISAIEKAHAKLAEAAMLGPTSPEAWQADGKALIRLGEHYREIGYLKEADRCLNTARSLHEQQRVPLPSSLLQDSGDCWNAMGRLSGEAYDFWKALDFYRSALKEDGRNAQVWTRHGQVTEALARLLANENLLSEAIDSYCQALAIDPECAEAHVDLANLNLHQYVETGNPNALRNAASSFETVVKLAPDLVEGWLGWAVLLLRKGERHRDSEVLKQALEKFEKAAQCDPHFALLLTSWGEALNILGTLTESLDLLRQGIAKVAEALELEPDNPMIWRTYASCLTELGYYFNDEAHYLDALDKIKIGLRYDDSEGSLWIILGRITMALGGLRSDVGLLEEACKHYETASQRRLYDLPALHNEWGVCLMRLTEATNERPYIEAAVAHFEKAVEGFQTGASGNVELEWLYNYGCALDFLGDFAEDFQHYEKAIQVLSFVVEQDPSYRNARYNLALAWAHLAEITSEVELYQCAVQGLEELVKEDSEDEVAWNELGMILISLAQLVRDPVHSELAEQYLLQAESSLQQASALGNTQAYYNLAGVSCLLGKHDLAMFFLERADAVNALPAYDDLIQDEWLADLRHTEAFRHFATRIKTKFGVRQQP